MPEEAFIRFNCPQCGAKAKARAVNAGLTVRCPKCGVQQVVPGTLLAKPVPQVEQLNLAQQCLDCGQPLEVVTRGVDKVLVCLACQRAGGDDVPPAIEPVVERFSSGLLNVLPRAPTVPKKEDQSVIFVSGPYDLRTGSPGVLTLHHDRMIFKSAFLKRPLFEVAYTKIDGVQVDTAERMTLARVIAFGIFAFGLKKKDKFMKLDFNDGACDVTLVFGQNGIDIDSLANKILARRRAAIISEKEG